MKFHKITGYTFVSYFQKKNMRVARAVHKSKIENSIKKHVQNEYCLEFILDQMKTNQSLHESVISNFFAR